MTLFNINVYLFNAIPDQISTNVIIVKDKVSYMASWYPLGSVDMPNDYSPEMKYIETIIPRLRTDNTVKTN